MVTLVGFVCVTYVPHAYSLQYNVQFVADDEAETTCSLHNTEAECSQHIVWRLIQT